MIYASTNWKKRRSLWGELKNIADIGSPSLVAGDFNCVTNPSYKKGGNALSWAPGELDLLNLMNYCSFTEVAFSDNSFTWCNNQPGQSRIWERLDYVLANPARIDTCFKSNVDVLERLASDHSHILLSIFEDRFSGKHIFRFEGF